ncbi:hypothetical protein ACSBR2_042724 [Camellia fascicularis]
MERRKEQQRGAEKQGAAKSRGTANRENGGWIPVFQQKARRNMGNSSIHTLFVDNLPKTMDPKGLYNMFTKFGVVNNVFMPLKRRKATRSRFGFVRYDCHIAAKVAIQKAIGVWCDNRALVVKSAAFRRDQKGEVQNVNFRKEFFKQGLKNVRIQEGRGRLAILSFDSIEALRNKRKVLGEWINDWCENVVELRNGLVFKQEREVWLRYYGVPLNLWNTTNFRKFGELWGEVLDVEDVTMSMSSLAYGKFRILTKSMVTVRAEYWET